jgi:hypothetical protein
MTFTERELALIMVALDNTANSILVASRETDYFDADDEAADMGALWNRLHEERLHLLRDGREETA